MKKKNKDFKKTKTIRLPIYPFDVTFLYLSEEGRRHQNEVAQCRLEGLNIFVYLREKNTPIPSVVHELFHAVEFIMETIKQPLSPSPNETWAYLLEYLMREYLKFEKTIK